MFYQEPLGGSRTPTSGLQYSYSVDYGTLRWMADDKRLQTGRQDGHRTMCVGFPSSLGLGVGGWSHSNFLASTACASMLSEPGFLLVLVSVIFWFGGIYECTCGACQQHTPWLIHSLWPQVFEHPHNCYTYTHSKIKDTGSPVIYGTGMYHTSTWRSTCSPKPSTLAPSAFSRTAPDS